MRERKNLRSDIWRESVADEVGEELAFHVEMRARELVTKTGITIEEARKIATARFGDMRSVQSECETIGSRRDRDMKRTTLWSEFIQDARYALRQIRSTPAFSLLVIGTLALGIGATTTIFSALNAVVLRPLAFENPDRVMYLTEAYEGETGDVTAGNFVDWRKQATLFDAVAAIDWGNYVVSTGNTPDQVLGAAITPEYFTVYGVQPIMGRAFTAEDAQPGAARTVILSHHEYAQRFRSDPSVVGTDITVNGEPARIIGVMPANFDPLLINEDIWVPLHIPAELIAQRGSRYLDVVGLVKAGTSESSVAQQLQQIAQRQAELYPNENKGRTISAQPIRSLIVGDYNKLLFLLLGSVGIVLLIACANVANLLLAKGASRQKELAVRGALGAGRPRLMRQLFAENLILALVTVAVSIPVAALASKLIVAYAPAGIPRIAETRIDGVVLAFALVVGIMSSLIFGLVPVMRAMRLDLQSTLRNGGRDARGTIRDWLRSSLVTAEVALSVLLLIGAGLMIRTSMKASGVDPGFRMDGVVAARVTLPEQSYPDPQQTASAYQQMVDRIAQLPGVQHAAASSLAPIATAGNEMFMNPEGKPNTNDNAVIARMRIISPQYLNAMGIELLRGRHFDSRDVRSGQLVTIVSEELAEKLWPGENAVGKRVACCEGDEANPNYKTVIGVARGIRTRGPMLPPDAEFYMPLAQVPPDAWNWLSRSMTVIATGTATAPLVDAVRAGVYEVDPSVPVYDVTTLQDALRGMLAPARFSTLLLSLLGALGLVLAATGVYGVVSYFVNLRRKEIGVRIALGASAASVFGLMLRQALAPVAAGLALGAGAALVATRLLTAALFDVTPTDPLTFAVVLAGILAVSAGAVLIPARRATQVPPTQALEG